MSESTTKNIFDYAKLPFKLAAEAGKSPAEGVAVQIRFLDVGLEEVESEEEEKKKEILIIHDSNRDRNAMLAIREQINLIQASREIEIDAIVFATEMVTDTGETLDPEKDSIENLRTLFNKETDPPPIFIVYGHGSDDHHIRLYEFTPQYI